MDKKQKKKLVPAVCFVLICGVAYLGIHYSGQRKEQIVLEKQDDKTEFAEADGVAGMCPEEATVSRIPEQTEEIYVHVCGAVETEGVFVLTEGSRLADGITAAGGFCENADTSYHNLASCLSDGQKVYVPTREETAELSVFERVMTNDAEAKITESDAGGGKVNINTAGAEELMTLNGIGEAKAKSILQYREKVGAFQSIEELKQVSGIGDAMFERVKEDIVAE